MYDRIHVYTYTCMYMYICFYARTCNHIHIWVRPTNWFVLGLTRKANDTGGGKIVLGSSTRQTSCDLGARGSACMVYRCGIKIKNSGTHIWLEPLRASLDGGIRQGCAQVWQLSGEGGNITTMREHNVKNGKKETHGRGENFER